MKIRFLNQHKCNISRGFSYIELLVYMAIISIFVTGAVMFTWDVIYGREKAYQHQVVEQNGRIAMAKLAYEIKNAQNIQSVSANQIILNNGSSNTAIALSNGNLQITYGTDGPHNITSNQVTVLSSSPLFTNLSTSDNNSKNIGISFTLQQNQSNMSQHFQAQTTMQKSIELKSPFNQARNLLMNLTNAALANSNRDITNVTLENSGTANITIDRVNVAWTGATGNRLNEIRINNSTVWSGTATSGITVDITNAVITPAGDAIPVNYIRFNSNMAGTVVTISYIMSDGSVTKMVIDFT